MNASVAGNGRGAVAEGACAPRIVIDESGREVSVLVDYRHYMTLLAVLASETDRDALPGYWRSALDGCLSAGV